MARIAIVEVDDELANLINRSIEGRGHYTIRFKNILHFLSALRHDVFDVALLGWFRPHAPEISLLRQIRAINGNGMGIVVLVNQADAGVIAEAVHAGADDYVIIPEAPAVIVARVEVAFRRLGRVPDAERFLKFGDYVFDRLTRSVSFGRKSVVLSRKEFALALLMFDRMNHPMSRAYLLETLWNANPGLSTRTLDMHVSRIRSKLELRPENGFRIAALSGYGYRLERFFLEDGLCTNSESPGDGGS